MQACAFLNRLPRISPGEIMNDEECVQRCLDGQREDFRILVERYQRSVYGFLWLRLRNHTLAEEGAQEAFVRAFTHLAKLKTPAGFHAWILGIAGKIALELRREGLRLEVSDSCPNPKRSPSTCWIKWPFKRPSRHFLPFLGR
jgi:RNA polymerase sigma-70 factor, ECF subfamily